MNSLPKTVTRQRRDCDLNPGRTAPESSTLTTRLASHVISYTFPIISSPRFRAVDYPTAFRFRFKKISCLRRVVSLSGLVAAISVQSRVSRDSKKPSRKPPKSCITLTVSSLSIIRSLYLARLGSGVTSNSRLLD